MAFVDPHALADMAGFTFSSSASISEFWANYGGLYFFYGLFLIWGAIGRARHRVAVTALLFTSLGLATGRLLGMVLVAFPGMVQLSFLGWEAISALLCVVCLRNVADSQKTIGDRET